MGTGVATHSAVASFRPGSSPPQPVPFALALNAAGRFWPGLQPPFRNPGTAVEAGSVRAGFDAAQRLEHLGVLRLGHVEDGLGAFRFGEVGTGIGRILRVIQDPLILLLLSLEHRDGPFELAADLFQALTSGGGIHRYPPPIRVRPCSADWRPCCQGRVRLWRYSSLSGALPEAP